jgi:hypothetical protein
MEGIMSKTIKDRSNQINELALRAAARLQAMVAAADASDKKAALESYRKVLRLVGRKHIAAFDARTALLEELVAELAEVTRAVKVRHPLAQHLTDLAALTDEALGLMKDEG